MRKMISSSDIGHKGQRLLPKIRDKNKTEKSIASPGAQEAEKKHLLRNPNCTGVKARG